MANGDRSRDRRAAQRPHLLSLAASLALAACALQAPPDAKQLADTELAHATPPSTFKAGGSPSPVQPGWLATFNDPRLPPLAEEALRYNADLRVAAARVEAAAAALKAAGGALSPEVNFAARSGGKATGSQGQLSGLLVAASWEIDLWGRVRYGRAAADAQFASAQADERAARQAIVAALAKAWFVAAESELQRRVVTDMLGGSETLVKLSSDRFRVGAGSDLEVTQARINLQNLRDSALQIDYALAQSRRALELILGRYPAAEIALPVELPAMPPTASTGVPSELLERRPDIVAAERRFAAAFARVGEARAARLPRISLTATLSSISSSTFVLQDSGDVSLGGGATLLFPIFNGGQLEAQVELRTAEQKQAGAVYAQTALKAFNEVETALASEASLAAREDVLRQSLSDNTRALDLEQVRYRVGSRDLRSVTQQQIAAYLANMSLLRVQTEQRVQRVQLHLALGGDFAGPGS
ncbi:MAG TPA: efflux transporter outer membrane subunit [Caldimonas sp.]|nr:efflux transporter outer membrane subunit [Caldimonas sp.]